MKLRLYRDETITLRLDEIAQNLNRLAPYFNFNVGRAKLSIPGPLVMRPQTYNKLNPEIIKESDGDDEVLLFTEIPYDNNYFWDSVGNKVILSLSGWDHLTRLSRNNGAVYFICAILIRILDVGSGHVDKNTGCINDFWQDKTGVDAGMRRALVCEKCLQIFKRNTNEKKTALLQSIQAVLKDLGGASRDDMDICDFWALQKQDNFIPGKLSDRQKEQLGFSTRITNNRTQNEPDYQNQVKSDESGHGRESTEQNVLRGNLITYLINEKGFPRDSMNYDNLEEYPDFDLVVKHPDTNEFLAIFNYKCGLRKDDQEFLNCMANEYKKKFEGIHNPFVYLIYSPNKSKEDFLIFEVEDDGTSTKVTNKDFPTYNQLLFASPLGAPGRRIYRALVELAKDKHNFNVHTPCRDYIDLQIKGNKRTAAQIHRLKESDKNIAIVIAGYEEGIYPDLKFNDVVRGDIENISGYSNKYPAEKNWLKGTLGHPHLRYKASVCVLQPGALFLKEIEKEVDELLELAKKNAESKGPAEPEESSSRIKDIVGNVATMADDRTSSKDLLGRESLVQALANMFVHTKEIEGFTVALFGNWGVGKSTVMELLEKQLKAHHSKRFIFAKFNAWAYEKTDNIAAGLAFEVVKALKNSFNLLCRLTLYICFIVREHWGGFIRWIIKLGIAALPFILLYLFRSKFGLTEEQEKTIKDLFGIGLAGGAIVIGFYVLKNFKNIVEHPLVTNLETCLNLPNYDKHLGLVPVLKRHIKILCGLTLKAGIGKWRWGKDKKLVVFVDDLDRCQPKCIAETLDAIRLVMDNPNVIVLIGIDHRIAFKAIEGHYKNVSDGKGEIREEEIARDYLGKIIQLPIRLQEPTVQELEEFINKRLFPNAVKLPLQEKQESQKLMQQQLKATDVEHETLKDLGEPPVRTSMSTGEYSPSRVVKSPSEEIIEIETEMLDADDEYYEFSDLSKKFGFSNPRQLLRLRNSYRLIKALELQKARKENQELGFDKLRDLMRMLFWQEFLFNRPKDLRQACLKTLYEDVDAEKISDEKTKVIIKQVKGLILESFKDKKIHDETEKNVRIVVLPHSQDD